MVTGYGDRIRVTSTCPVPLGPQIPHGSPHSDACEQENAKAGGQKSQSRSYPFLVQPLVEAARATSPNPAETPL
eukprot:scaffold45588_cov31-Tisochrysis_lutea.AAC.3